MAGQLGLAVVGTEPDTAGDTVAEDPLGYRWAFVLLARLVPLDTEPEADWTWGMRMAVGSGCLQVFVDKFQVLVGQFDIVLVETDLVEADLVEAECPAEVGLVQTVHYLVAKAVAYRLSNG